MESISALGVLCCGSVIWKAPPCWHSAQQSIRPPQVIAVCLQCTPPTAVRAIKVATETTHPPSAAVVPAGWLHTPHQGPPSLTTLPRLPQQQQQPPAAHDWEIWKEALASRVVMQSARRWAGDQLLEVGCDCCCCCWGCWGHRRVAICTTEGEQQTQQRQQQEQPAVGSWRAAATGQPGGALG
jgi:hypothetical protein